MPSLLEHISELLELTVCLRLGCQLVQESMEFVESILADVERLGLQYTKPITYTSDYFPQMLDLAERLIKAGHMYADDTPVEQMRAVRIIVCCLRHLMCGKCPSAGCSCEQFPASVGKHKCTSPPDEDHKVLVP